MKNPKAAVIVQQDKDTYRIYGPGWFCNYEHTANSASPQQIAATINFLIIKHMNEQVIAAQKDELIEAHENTSREEL